MIFQVRRRLLRNQSFVSDNLLPGLVLDPAAGERGEEAKVNDGRGDRQLNHLFGQT